MILTIKHKFSIYRRFEQDIWGICFTDTRVDDYKEVNSLEDIRSKYLKFFFKLFYEKQKSREINQRRYIYRLDIMPEKRFIKDYKKRFLSIRITRLYFLTFQDYQFRRLFKRASKKDGI